MSEKTGPKNTPTRNPLLDARNRLVTLYRDVIETVVDRDVQSVDWHVDRTAAADARFEHTMAMQRAGWPTEPLPSASLAPSVGYNALASASPLNTVMVVSVFGRSADGLSDALDRISARQSQTENFRPVFFTDCKDFSTARHAGFTFEYFPPELYSVPEAKERFSRRFRYLHQKWGSQYLIDMSAAGFLANQLEDYKSYFIPPSKETTTIGTGRREVAPIALPPDIVALRAAYDRSDIASRADDFVLYRILGNDLPPRHSEGQTLANLRFIIENEPDFEGCKKRFVLNRIIDPNAEQVLVDLLEDSGQDYDLIPFELDEYAQAEWDLAKFSGPPFFFRGDFASLNTYQQLRAEAFARRHKNRYAINNNGARNFALRQGRDLAKWVLPWDGNCFLTERAWTEISDFIRARPYFKYLTVPMARVTENALLLDNDFVPEAQEEPQMVFRCDTEEDFADDVHYGRRPKVELFYRLGIEGDWSEWSDDYWDLPRPELSKDAGTASSAGWVARLNSGVPSLEASGKQGQRDRGEARIAGIVELLDRLDDEHRSQVLSHGELLVYDEEMISSLSTSPAGSPSLKTFARLVRDADVAMQREAGSVVQKERLPPSLNANDYFHPAPYWWPNPDTPDGIPFIRRDGFINPATRLFSPQSVEYDRTRMQRMFDDSIVLSLAWLATGNRDYAVHAAHKVRTWFVDPETRMNPHLRFAQPRSQKPQDDGSKSGVIETKDIHFLLDAVRLLERADTLTADDSAALKEWLREFLVWLQTSKQGVDEQKTANNHGVCYDLQVLAIAAYLGDVRLINQILRTSRERILEQFDPDGKMPEEMRRTQTAHYSAFGMQCWINLADLAEGLGDNLWTFHGQDGRGLAKGMEWLFSEVARGEWQYEQIAPFDNGRYLPILHAARLKLGMPGVLDGPLYSSDRAVFFPHDGIKPYWMLGRGSAVPKGAEEWGDLEDALARAEFALHRAWLIPVRADPSEIKAAQLEKTYWSGYGKRAEAALKRTVADPAATSAEVGTAARALVRLSYFEENWEQVLAYAKLLGDNREEGRREKALVTIASLTSAGRFDEASAIVADLSTLFPEHPDTLLATASLGLARHSKVAGRPVDNPLQALSESYLAVGLEPFLPACDDASAATPPGSESAPHPNRAGDIGAFTSGYASGPQGVSVLVSITADAKPELLKATLRSLSQQTYAPSEVVLVDAAEHSARAILDQIIEEAPLPIRRQQGADALGSSGSSKDAPQEGDAEAIAIMQAGDVWHPSLLASSMLLLSQPRVHAVSCSVVQLNPEGRPVGSWNPGFGFVHQSSGPVLFLKSSARLTGGWTISEGVPDALFWHRFAAFHGDLAIAPHPVDLPLVAKLGQQPRKGFERFMYGPARDELRRYTRVVKARKALFASLGRSPEEMSAEIHAPLPAIDDHGAVFDELFVGDFSADGLMMLRMEAFIRKRIALGAGQKQFGLFHWPAFRNAAQPLANEIAALVDEGLLVQVSAHSGAVDVETIVLCNPYLVHSQIDGLPEVDPTRIVATFANAHSMEDRLKVEGGHLPNDQEIQSVWQAPVTWVPLD